MRIEITGSDLDSNTNLSKIILAKLFSTRDWGSDDFSHAEYEWLLANDKAIDGAELYSPVLTESQMNGSVPDNWPGSIITISETEARQKTWFEYCQYLTVSEGYCVKYAGGAADHHKGVTRPTYSQLKVWVSTAGGFLTKAEALGLVVAVEDQ